MGIEMTEQQMLIMAGVFIAGLVLGVLIMLISRKVANDSTPKQLKAEMENYQSQVEAHFDETSQKFKDMAVQYQDLYAHLSKGATSLCRTENIAPLLTDEKSPLNQNYSLDKNEADASQNASTATRKEPEVKITDKNTKDAKETDVVASTEAPADFVKDSSKQASQQNTKKA